MFNSDRSSKQFFYAAQTGYGNKSGKISVYPNHYGVSTLRAVLNNMSVDTQYFTKSEQNLMNRTTISTTDTKNNVVYTTSDKLYALSGNYNDIEKIMAGSDDSVEISSLYWDGGKSFWLRTAYDEIFSIALLAIPGNGVVFDYVNYGDALQPAMNLDVSSVLFASLATVADDASESEIDDSMVLRFDCESENAVKINETATADKGGIKVSPASDTETTALYLYIQGNDGDKDWVYSKKITEETSVLAEDIISEKKLSDLDLSKCKIWLEKTVDNISYAKMINTVGEHDLTFLDKSSVDVTEKN
jgi:sugar/nucleoside kinase (ribokinase family)